MEPRPQLPTGALEAAVNTLVITNNKDVPKLRANRLTLRWAFDSNKLVP